MQPNIGRSIGQGFRIASRMWAGIGVFAGCSVALVAVTGLLVALTNPPKELFPEQPATAQATLTPPPAPSADTSNAATSPESAISVTTQASTAASTTPAPDAQAKARQQEDERRVRVIGEWMGRAWPVLLLCLLLFTVVKVWLIGGQIGYVAARIADPRAHLRTFFQAAGRAFWALLRGWLLMAAAFIVAMLAMLVIILIMSGLDRVMPGWLLAVLAVLLTLALTVGVVWLSIKLLFWFIAIVVDGVGPIAGLRATFRTTRGAWWPLAGLSVLLGAISLGVGLVLIIGEWMGRVIGGPAGMILTLLTSLVYMVGYFYLLFVSSVAFVQWYVDANARAPAAPVSSA
ncbi:MAG: hypothetical protein HY352_03130 [Candidatus Omnitrophica bacterium]|nr:hypothetical protein [Candidatus Omnitrophota bacterium]